MFEAVILAGGKATRMLPATRQTPKALLDVAGQPFMRRQINYLVSQGIKKITICVGHLADQIESEFRSGDEFGIQISYSHDGAKPLGTGGALKRATPLLGDDFFVLYGDSFLPIDFSSVQAAFVNARKPALMTVLRNANQWDVSNVNFLDGAILQYDKFTPTNDMKHIDYGLGVLNRSAFDAYCTEASFDLASYYHELSLAGNLAGYQVSERFYEIGSEKGLADTIAYFSASI